MTRRPTVKKSKGQTDKRIESLSASDFEQEFGFRPDDQIEQRYFATCGERLIDPAMRESAERQARIRDRQSRPIEPRALPEPGEGQSLQGGEEPSPLAKAGQPKSPGFIERVSDYIKPRSKEGSQ